MQGVEAQQADFRNADLRQANLGGAYLEGAMLPQPAATRRTPSPSEIARHRRPPEQGQANGQDHGQAGELDKSRGR